ncbi:hypothetical protein D3C76_1244070 [compost metagenome]
MESIFRDLHGLHASVSIDIGKLTLIITSVHLNFNGIENTLNIFEILFSNGLVIHSYLNDGIKYIEGFGYGFNLYVRR